MRPITNCDYIFFLYVFIIPEPCQRSFLDVDYNVRSCFTTHQVQQLLSTVRRMKQRGVRYTKDTFHSIKEEQEKFFARENAENLRAEIERKISLLQDGISQVLTMTESGCDVTRLEQGFDGLLRDVAALKDERVCHSLARSLQLTPCCCICVFLYLKI